MIRRPADYPRPGYYYLVYRICEIANATNCDQATVTIDLSGSGS